MLDQNNNNIKSAVKNTVWEMNRAANQNPTYRELDEKFRNNNQKIEQTIETASDKLDNAVSNGINKIKNAVITHHRPLRRRNLRGIFRPRSILDRLDQINNFQRQRNIDRQERIANWEEKRIESLENAENKTTSMEDSIKNRKADLEEFRRQIQEEKQRIENLDIMLNGDRNQVNNTTSNLATAGTLPSSDTPETSLEVIDGGKDTPTNTKVNMGDPNYIKLIAADGEGVARFRHDYRVARREEMRSQLSTLVCGSFTGILAGITMYYVYNINPSLVDSSLQSTASFQQMIQTTINNVMSDPSTQTVLQTFDSGMGQAMLSSFGTLIATVASAGFLSRYTNRRNERQLVEDNNPLNIKDDVESIAKHM